ncbi:MAG: enoyl-ACP reductase [Planctomycetaceae bacterium]
MGLFEGKQGLVFGVANDRSIAAYIAQELHSQGARMAFTHLPDSDPERAKMARRVHKVVDSFDPAFVMSCDVNDDASLDAVFAKAQAEMGPLDFVLHSIAYAPLDDLQKPVHAVSRDGFKLSMEISVYSLLAIAHRAKDALRDGGSILTLTYLGGERVIPGYNLMGLCKAGLESAVAYLSNELGPAGIRVNALSAGPLKTLSSSAVSDFEKMLQIYPAMSPLRRNITHEEVGRAGMFMLSDLASGISGENLHVDAGFHVMGAPPPEAGR